MSRIEYFLHIRVAGSGGELYDLRKQAATDGDLTRAEAEDVSDAIGRRYAQLNHAANPNPKPRWS